MKNTPSEKTSKVKKYPENSDNEGSVSMIATMTFAKIRKKRKSPTNFPPVLVRLFSNASKKN